MLEIYHYKKIFINLYHISLICIYDKFIWTNGLELFQYIEQITQERNFSWFITILFIYFKFRMSRPIHKRNWTCQSNKALLKVMYYSCINKTWVISTATFIWRNCALLYVTFCSWHAYVTVSKLVILFKWEYVCVITCIRIYL